MGIYLEKAALILETSLEDTFVSNRTGEHLPVVSLAKLSTTLNVSMVMLVSDYQVFFFA
jgi:hypothetical protein